MRPVYRARARHRLLRWLKPPPPGFAQSGRPGGAGRSIQTLCAAMTYLDADSLAHAAADSAAFLGRKPYPYVSLQGIVREDGFARLCAELPRLELFDGQFGMARAYGQKSHDRYALQYQPALDSELSPPWREFIQELHGPAYREFLRRMYGLAANERFVLSMHWHFAPNGASVSPHTDARRKIGSHIFYLNTPQDWDPAWGGQTRVLDDGGKLSAHARDTSSLQAVAASEILGNRSFMFMRTEHSWHSVEPISAPDGRLRKVFIVVINRVNFQVLWRRLRGKDPDGHPLQRAAAG